MNLYQFLENLENLRKHGFITRMQSAYYKRLKEDLPVGEVLMVCNIAENCGFLIQAFLYFLYFLLYLSISSNHWLKTSVT